MLLGIPLVVGKHFKFYRYTGFNNFCFHFGFVYFASATPTWYVGSYLNNVATAEVTQLYVKTR